MIILRNKKFSWPGEDEWKREKEEKAKKRKRLLVGSGIGTLSLGAVAAGNSGKLADYLESRPTKGRRKLDKIKKEISAINKKIELYKKPDQKNSDRIKELAEKKSKLGEKIIDLTQKAKDQQNSKIKKVQLLRNIQKKQKDLKEKFILSKSEAEKLGKKGLARLTTAGKIGTGLAAGTVIGGTGLYLYKKHKTKDDDSAKEKRV